MQVHVSEKNHQLVIQLQGDWELSREIPTFDRVVDEPHPRDGIRAVSFDTTELGTWDSSLAVFLLQGVRYCDRHDLDFREETLPAGVVRLLDLAIAVPLQNVPEETKDSLLARIGKAGISSYERMKDYMTFIGELGLSFARLLLGRERMRWQDFWSVVQSNSAGALPIITLISFLVGLIIAFLGAVVLEQFAASYYVSYLVGFGMLRQMGALMTAVIITGRTGAAFAAELGSMKIMEEIDAYKTLGLSPIGYLVLPRVLGLTLMMPLLTIYSMFIGILGGLIVTVIMLDITAPLFITGLLYPLTLMDGLLGVFKGLVFGAVIGVSGCLQGITAGSDAQAVGKATTSAVVVGITLIIVANAVIDVLAATFGI